MLLQGPLWRNIRGYGLAYHYNIVLNPNEGILQLYLFRSTDIVQAFRKTKEIMVCCSIFFTFGPCIKVVHGGIGFFLI